MSMNGSYIIIVKVITSLVINTNTNIIINVNVDMFIGIRENDDELIVMSRNRNKTISVIVIRM